MKSCFPNVRTGLKLFFEFEVQAPSEHLRGVSLDWREMSLHQGQRWDCCFQFSLLKSFISSPMAIKGKTLCYVHSFTSGGPVYISRRFICCSLPTFPLLQPNNDSRAGVGQSDTSQCLSYPPSNPPPTLYQIVMWHKWRPVRWEQAKAIYSKLPIASESAIINCIWAETQADIEVGKLYSGKREGLGSALVDMGKL